jgi:hypothetical protein
MDHQSPRQAKACRTLSDEFNRNAVASLAATLESLWQVILPADRHVDHDFSA